MKRKKLQTVKKPLSLKMIVMVLTIGLMLFACKKNDSPYNPSKKPDSTMSLAEAAKISEAKKDLVKFMKDYKIDFASTNNQGTKRSATKPSLAGNADVNHNKALIQQVIDSDDYECERTELNEYVSGTITDWDDDDWWAYSWTDLWMYYSYVIDNSDGSDDYYGAKSEYTNATKRTFKDLKRFWDINNGIVMYGQHGSFFKDKDKMVETVTMYRDLLGWIPGSVTDSQISDLVDDLKTIYGSDHYWKYNHPLLTFNAFAASAIPELNIIDKIVMGDGIQDAYAALGYDDVAPQAILAHEYGHHVQFKNNVDFGSSPEDTRRTELMADAMAAYFLTHKQGAAMNWKRTKEYFVVFFNIGDCQFSNDGHHGTPNQRMRAAQFGYDVASDTKKKGKVMKSADFIELFDDNLADIVSD